MLFLRARIAVTVSFALLSGACAYEERYVCDDAPALALGALALDARDARELDARDALDARELAPRTLDAPAPKRPRTVRSAAFASVPRPPVAFESHDAATADDPEPETPETPDDPGRPRPIPVDPVDPDAPHDPGAPDDPDDPSEPLPDDPAATAGNPDDDAFVPSHLANFSLVEDGLAGMAHPGEGPVLESALDDLQHLGFDIFVSLTEAAPDAARVAAHGMIPYHLPIRDLTPPTASQARTFTALVRSAQAEGRKVVVHCFAGLGRTGTMLAARLVMDGVPAAQAIARIRALRPGSIETPSQEAFLFSLAATLATP